MKRIKTIILSLAFGVLGAMAQNENITVQDDQNGREEVIGLPEGMTVTCDSLINEWMAKKYLFPDTTCVNPDYNPTFTPEKVCKACGKCVAACPKHLIELVPYEAMHLVQCSSKDKGKAVMDACSVGCIGCHLCEKNCPSDAVHVIDNVAYIDQEKCTCCGICAEKCPKKIIL